MIAKIEEGQTQSLTILSTRYIKSIKKTNGRHLMPRKNGQFLSLYRKHRTSNI